MAIRKKLGNDPLARRQHEPAAGTDILQPAPQLPQATRSANNCASLAANLAANLAALFPLPLYCTPAARKESSRDERWRCVLDEQFRRAALALPTVFGRSSFTPDQFADALAVLTREALLRDGLPPNALPLRLEAVPLPSALPLPVALVLLHGCYGVIQALLHVGQPDKKNSETAGPATLLLRLEHLSHSGEFMLRLLEPAPAEHETHARRLLDRDRLWPAVQPLGLALARRGCRVFLFTAKAAEFRIIIPASTGQRLAA